MNVESEFEVGDTVSVQGYGKSIFTVIGGSVMLDLDAGQGIGEGVLSKFNDSRCTLVARPCLHEVMNAIRAYLDNQVPHPRWCLSCGKQLTLSNGTEVA